MSDSITVLSSRANLRQAKLVTGIAPDITVEGHQACKRFNGEEHSISSLSDLDKLLHHLVQQPRSFVVRGALTSGPQAYDFARSTSNNRDTGEAASLREKAHTWLALDMDGVPYEGDPANLLACYDAALQHLPVAFQAVECIVQASGSHGIKPGARLRLWFWLSRPLHGVEVKSWLRDIEYLDPAIFATNLPIFTAAPLFAGGAAEHIPERLLRVDGDPVVSVPDVIEPSTKLTKPFKPEGSLEDIKEALARIPNNTLDLGREDYIKIALATFSASGGSVQGFELFEEWASQSPRHSPDNYEAHWDMWFRFFSSPPEKIGAGTLFYRAHEFDSKWFPSTTRRNEADVDFPGQEIDNEIIEIDWTARLLRHKSKEDGGAGAIKTLIANALIAFRLAPEWKATLAYDAFSNRVKLLAPPPWDRDTSAYPRDANNDDGVLATQWLQEHNINVSTKVAGEAFGSAARQRTFHPVRDYLKAQTWDGTPRINKWLHDLLGAEDTPLHEAFGSKFLISAVARVMRPGCKVDTVLVLEGPQGLKKSQALKRLSSPWYVDHMPDLHSKDALQQIQGVWIVEHAEMDKLGKAETNRAKVFISTGVDRFRPPYMAAAEDFPRQCVFAATLNPDGKGYLKDETGGRRYWPVECAATWEPGRRIDLTRLDKVRDQLWAEAFFRFNQGECWWIDDADLESDQEAATAMRYDHDVWTYRVLKAIASRPFVTILDILTNTLDKDVGAATLSDHIRVGKILNGAKWRRTTNDGEHGFTNPDLTVKAKAEPNSKEELDDLVMGA